VDNTSVTKRSKLIPYCGFLLTEDTIQACTAASLKASQHGWTIHFMTDDPEDIGIRSMREAGRRIRVHFSSPGFFDLQHGVDFAWSILVPLRFTPLQRYPDASSPFSTAFDFLGPWSVVNERLLARGLGTSAWVSTCVAAQCDVGSFTGDNLLARQLQSQLHRTGQNPGKVDGIVGPRTQAAMQQAGLSGMSLQAAVTLLCSLPSAIPEQSGFGRHSGQLILSGQKISVSTFGGVKTTSTAQGCSIVVDSPGRMVVDIGG